MAKKEKVVDLKQRVDKISEQHLTELQSIVNTLNATQFNIGKIEVQKHKLLNELATVQDNITMLQDKMTKEYGTFDINIDDGTINWPKENKDEK